MIIEFDLANLQCAFVDSHDGSIVPMRFGLPVLAASGSGHFYLLNTAIARPVRDEVGLRMRGQRPLHTETPNGKPVSDVRFANHILLTLPDFPFVFGQPHHQPGTGDVCTSGRMGLWSIRCPAITFSCETSFGYPLRKCPHSVRHRAENPRLPPKRRLARHDGNGCTTSRGVVEHRSGSPLQTCR